MKEIGVKLSTEIDFLTGLQELQSIFDAKKGKIEKHSIITYFGTNYIVDSCWSSGNEGCLYLLTECGELICASAIEKVIESRPNEN